MDNSEILQLTDDELIAFFDQLFPCGFAGEDVLSEIAPEGWHCSPLLSCFHPSPEQIFKEHLQIHSNIKELIHNKDQERPEPTLEDIRAEWKDSPVNATDEVTELLGRCLWDIFSCNHEVVAADGRIADTGSFRGSSAFLDDYLNRKSEKACVRQSDYMRFYMGTMWLQVRMDLEIVYVMIFRRLKLLGADWVYRFPEMHFVDLMPLRKELEGPTVCSPSEAWEASQEDEKHQAEVEKMRSDLNEINIRSRKEAMDLPKPTTVRSYHYVYGHNPRGWPPG
jgi:hypothetical protein